MVLGTTIDEFDEDDELLNAPFEITEKKKLSDVASELPNVMFIDTNEDLA